MTAALTYLVEASLSEGLIASAPDIIGSGFYIFKEIRTFEIELKGLLKIGESLVRASAWLVTTTSKH